MVAFVARNLKPVCGVACLMFSQKSLTELLKFTLPNLGVLTFR
jgi:hypothetical protein